MLAIENLHSGYGGIPVLTGVSLSVAAGAFVGVLGHNGMGKTTLLKTIAGLVPATQGDIRLDGQSITRLPCDRRIRRGLGYVQQGRGILPGLTVRDNLRFAAVARRRPASALDAILAEFPRLGPLLDRPGGTLSGGEQQLLAVARALVQEPRLLLLDEPTEGIQPSIIEEIVDRLRVIRKTRGLAMLLVEQNIDVVKALSDRVLLIQKGTITREVAVDALTDNAGLGDFA